MKMLNMFVALAVLAMSSVALANDYVNFAEDVAPPADPAQLAPPAPEAVEVAPMENYGYAPTWSSGCCERTYGAHDHLWDNYCAEKHCGWFGLGHGRGCCGKAFGGCGGFSKGGCCRSWHLPKLHLPKLNCCQKTACCKTTSHKGSCCRKFHLPKLRLFSRHGCCKSKCCEGSEVFYEGAPEVNDMPAPAMDVNEVPMPPMGPAV